MDAGGWALPGRPAPGAGRWTRLAPEHVGPTLAGAQGRQGPAAPRTRPRGRRGGTGRNPRRPREAPDPTERAAASAATVARENAIKNLRKDNPLR